jgi:Fic family protein
MSDDWREEYYTLIDDCQRRDKLLSAWDADFLESIRERLDSNRELSVKQVAKLEEIWEKATSKG